jgi:signal transduction histidine kinase
MLSSKQLSITYLKGGGLALLIVLGVAAGVVGLCAVWLSPPPSDLRDLFFFLLISGGISVALSLGWMVWGQQRLGLRFQLIATYLMAALIVLVNLSVTSSLMFLSNHDFSLLTLLVIFSGAVSVFFAFLLSDRLGRQVDEIVRGAQGIAAGRYDTRVTAGGSRELAELADAFNKMATQLESAFSRQQEMEQNRKELVAAISHDLRTPLASLRLMTEAVSDGVADEQQTRVFLERMRGEVEYMTGLIEDLFELSQLDAGALKLKKERGNLADLISDTLESLRAQADNKHQSLQGAILTDLPELEFDHRKIQRVLNNLIGNAIRYTHESGNIQIVAQRKADRVKVCVIDNGDGIPSSDLEKIFEPFYRGERSRGREQGGTGLGLAIARGLIEAHGGLIWAENLKKGSRFTFELPL